MTKKYTIIGPYEISPIEPIIEGWSKPENIEGVGLGIDGGTTLIEGSGII